MCVRRATPWLTSVTFDKDYSTLLYPFSVVKVSCKATDTKSGALSRALPVQAKTGLADTVLAETTILTDKLSENFRGKFPLVYTLLEKTSLVQFQSGLQPFEGRYYLEQ